MEGYMTPDRTANAVMLDFRFQGYHLLVEGIKDVKLYGKFIQRDNIKIRPAFGHQKVKDVIAILDERGFDKRVGIIDSDFKKIMEIPEDLEGVFMTDDHDIEVMIIKTKALENVLNLYCSDENIEKYEREKGISIRDSLFNVGKEIGYLKYANRLYDLGLVFKPKLLEGNTIRYNKFTCTKNLDFLGHLEMIKTIMNYSRDKGTDLSDEETIVEKYKEVSVNEFDLLQLVNGHDLSNLLYILMKKVLKSNNKMLSDYKAVEDSLILAYESAYFKETDIYTSIVNWGRNKEIVIFDN